MATGDVKNNLRKLLAELKRINYPMTDVNVKALSLGAPTAFLPILHYIFLDFSVDLTEFFARDYELYGKTDLRFVETVYKIMRDVFQYKPHLTREQFLAIGFAERKIIQVCEILKSCREKYSKLNPKGSKTDKKATNKLKAKSNGNESKEKDKISTKSSLKSSHKSDFQQINVTEEPSKRTGKSILKTRKDDDKENKRESKSAGTKTGEKQTTNVESFGLKTGIKNVRWNENEKSTVLSSFYQSNPPSSLQQLTTTVTLPHPPKLIPAPVSMTTAPEPSPDLMLTPLTKTKHQAIPLSNSRHAATTAQNANISLVDLTDSTPVVQPKIVRHSDVDNCLLPQQDVVCSNPILSHSTGDNVQHNMVRSNIHVPSNIPSTSQESELASLRTLVTEMQEKLDTVLATNNEMSARIVLLENKVKLLEEASEKNTSRSCSTRECIPKPLETARTVTMTTRPVTMETTRSVTMETTRPTIFQPTHLANRSESLPVTMVTSRPLVTTSADGYMSQRRVPASANSIQGPSHGYKSQSLATRRHLLDEFSDSQLATATANDSEGHVNQSDFSSNEQTTPAVIEISDDDVELVVRNSAISMVHSPQRMCDTQEFDVISPLATKDIHLKFSDPTTTATILNVERRLKETKEMLVNATNKGISMS